MLHHCMDRARRVAGSLRVFHPLLSCLLLLAACSADDSVDMVFDPRSGDDGADATATFTQVQQQILTPSCALAGCHASGTFPDLTAGASYAAIVDRADSQGSLLIAPGDAEGSYLYRKVTGADGIAGSRMPRGAPALTEAQVELLASWITRGAPND